MIISAWECKCGTYNPKLATNLKRSQAGQDHKERLTAFEITKVKVICKNVDCGFIKTVGVIGA